MRYDKDIVKKRLKEVAGKSFKEIGEEIGINNLTAKLSGIKNRSHLTVFDLMAISEKYDCSIDYLLGLSERVAINNAGDVLLTDIIKVFDTLFEKGVYSLDSDNIQLSNDVLNYLYTEIKAMQRLKNSGSLSRDNYETWLNGLCTDFQYYALHSPSTLKQLEKELKKCHNRDFHFLSFDEWKEKEKEMFLHWGDMSDRQLYKCYVEDVCLFYDVLLSYNKNKTSLDLDSFIDDTLNATLKYPSSRKGFEMGLKDMGFTDAQCELELKELEKDIKS